MRVMHYPPQTGPIDDRVVGIGAHTEYEPFTGVSHSTDVTPSYEVFTILYQQDDIQALQVLNSAGKWIKAPPIPGTLVVK